MKTAIIFGGSGFVGLHFSRFLLDQAGFGRIVLADIKQPQDHLACQFVAADLQAGRISYVHSDVRQPIGAKVTAGLGKVDFVANFAAVHREPGHAPHEYYETNLPGAENVCAFATAQGCNDVLFTSSISPYGPSELARDESSIPTPETAYGGSKLAAEWIHRTWQAGDATHRRLLIVRPGVIFGPGEGGNVSRLVKMLSRGFFVYAGNQHTRKAGIYIKELCNAMWWMHELQAMRPAGVAVANMTLNPGPSMQEYVEAVQRVVGKRAFVPSIPRWLLLGAARVIQTVAGPLGVMRSVNMVRVRKLVRSNNILPGVLQAEGYPYVYTLESALADWRQALPAEWQA